MTSAGDDNNYSRYDFRTDGMVLFRTQSIDKMNTGRVVANRLVEMSGTGR